MGTWFTENILPWLLDQLGVVINPDTAEKRGNTWHVILLLMVISLAFMLFDAAQLTYAENGEKIEAVTRLESAKERIAALEADVHDLEQENKALLKAMSGGPDHRYNNHTEAPVEPVPVPKVVTAKPKPQPKPVRDSKDETTAIYQRRMTEQINGG